MEKTGELKNTDHGWRGRSQVLALKGCLPAARPVPFLDRSWTHLPALGEISPRYENKVPGASTPWPQLLWIFVCTAEAAGSLAQNGLTTARITMPIISTVGTSLIMR